MLACLLRDVAAVCAISELAQSRLTTIHGGRDDLVTIHLLFDRLVSSRPRVGFAAPSLTVRIECRSTRFPMLAQTPLPMPRPPCRKGLQERA